jgi:hypothetical protein
MTARKDKLGPLTVPITTSVTLGGSLATIADPAIAAMLAAFKSTLNTKLGTAWDNAASTLGTNPVVGTYPYEPIPVHALRTWRWPALFMWRERERLFNRTQVYRCAECTGKLLYVLPPLPYEHAVRLEPIRVAVRTTLDLFIQQHGDPDYASGASPITASSLESFEFTGAEYGWLPSQQELQQPHPMVQFDWTMRERQSFVSGNYQALTRIDTTITSMNEGGSTASTTVVQMQYVATS